MNLADNKYSGGTQVTATPATPSGERPPVRGYPLVLYGVPRGIVRASHHHCDLRIPRGSHRPSSSSRPRPATPCSIWLTRPWDFLHRSLQEQYRTFHHCACILLAKGRCAFEYDMPSAPPAGVFWHLLLHWHARSSQSSRAISHDAGSALSRTREWIISAHSHRELFIVFHGLLFSVKRHLLSNN